MVPNPLMRRRATRPRRPVLQRAAAACALALALLAGAGTPLGAQVVQGTLLDEEGDRAMTGARLFLLDASGGAVDSTFTDASGRYRLEAARAGTYIVQFQMDGWASAGSRPIALEGGAVQTHDLPVTLVSSDAMRHMSEMIRSDERLQTSLPLVCGEALRPWEAGLLVGTVRARATNAPIAGVHVAVATGERVTRSTQSNEKGIYILCNVPLGDDVAILTRTPDGAEETTGVEIRAGMVSWYDLRVGPRR